MAVVKTITFKIGPMRKEASWVVYPKSHDDPRDPRPTLFVQSDKRALLVNKDTKKGMLSNGKGHPGFHTCSKLLGAVEVDIPDDLLAKITEAQPKKGDEIGRAGSGVFIG